MSKNFLVGLIAAVLLFGAANVKADMVTFMLDWTNNGGNLGGRNGLSQNQIDAVNNLVGGMTFTAAENDAKDGIIFMLSSERFLNVSSSEFFFHTTDHSGMLFFSDAHAFSGTFCTWESDFKEVGEVGANPPPYTWAMELHYAEGGSWASFMDLLAPPAALGIAFHITDLRSTGIHIGGSGVHVYTDGYIRSYDPPPVVPEPATLALMGLGLAGIGAVARRRMVK